MLIELTSVPDNKSIGIKCCQKINEKVSSVPIDTADEKYRRYYWQQYHDCNINDPAVQSTVTDNLL